MALTSTTLASAKALNDKTIKLTSTTGIANKMLVYTEGEFLRVTDITLAPTIGVVPGYQGTGASAHDNGAPAWFGLAADYPQTPLGPSFNSLLKSAVSVSTTSAAFATDTYLVGSAVPVPSGGFVNGMRYICTFDMVKTAAGTATPIVVVRFGALGTTADTAVLTFTFAAGTAAADTGTIVVMAHFRIAGSAAILAGTCEIRHALAATGITSTGASGQAQIAVVSSAFDSTIANGILGVSFNGGTSFSGTGTIVESELKAF